MTAVMQATLVVVNTKFEQKISRSEYANIGLSLHVESHQYKIVKMRIFSTITKDVKLKNTRVVRTLNFQFGSMQAYPVYQQ